MEHIEKMLSMQPLTCFFSVDVSSQQMVTCFLILSYGFSLFTVHVHAFDCMCDFLFCGESLKAYCKMTITFPNHKKRRLSQHFPFLCKVRSLKMEPSRSCLSGRIENLKKTNFMVLQFLDRLKMVNFSSLSLICVLVHHLLSSKHAANVRLLSYACDR